MKIKKCDICGKEIEPNRVQYIVKILNDAYQASEIESTKYFDACDGCLDVIKEKVRDIQKLADILKG